MAEIVTMPRLSDTMTEGVVAQWHKKVGDRVEEGDVLAEIETDKATMEFESFQEGVLLHIGIAEGDAAPVDSILAILGEKGEDISAILAGVDTVASTETTEVVKEVEVAESNTKSSADMAANLNVEVVTMPRLSDTMTEGVVAQWHKKVGDKVVEGDVLAEIETDKATMEFESFQEGTLLYIGVQEGESAPVDAILAILGEAGTDVSAIVNSGSKPTKEESKPVAKPTTSNEQPTPNNKKKETSNQQPVKQTKTVDGRILASPLAKKLASEKGIDLSTISGTGESGRVIKRDIDSYKEEAIVVEQVAQAVASPYQESFEEVKVSQMRKTIARRLVESKNEAPHYYLTVEIDMDQAIANRKAINNMPDTKVSFNDMVIKAAAMALKKHPNVNTSWQGDKVRHNQHVNIGVAIAVEDGLLVPVIRFADTKQLTTISAEVKDYAVKAKAKKLQPEDWEGSTFTISNLGMFGIEEFTSIINQPDSSILSVGAIVQKPVVKNGEIVVGNTMKVTMANDHRTVDGATGAMFLQTFKMYLENPVTMIA
jgi:pyruvate dehydrogenase E2 component (dihydrolipoamide acetyltransferase)